MNFIHYNPLLLVWGVVVLFPLSMWVLRPVVHRRLDLLRHRPGGGVLACVPPWGTLRPWLTRDAGQIGWLIGTGRRATPR